MRINRTFYTRKESQDIYMRNKSRKDCRNNSRNNYKKKEEENKNQGFATVELSLYIPLIFTVCLSSIFVLLQIYNRETVRGKQYAQIYQSSLAVLEENKIDEIEEICWNDYLIHAETKSEIKMQNGNIIYTTTISPATQIQAKTKLSGCSDRLRRWQVYGTIIKN